MSVDAIVNAAITSLLGGGWLGGFCYFSDVSAGLHERALAEFDTPSSV